MSLTPKPVSTVKDKAQATTAPASTSAPVSNANKPPKLEDKKEIKTKPKNISFDIDPFAKKKP